MRMHRKSTQRKLASHKKASGGKTSRRSLVTIAEKIDLEAKKKLPVVKKKQLQLIAVITPPVINQLS